MPNLTDKYLNRERDLARERQMELSYTFMQAVARELDRRPDWNMSRLAREIGVDRSQVSRWLNGTANLRFDTAARIEKALGTALIEVDRAESVVFQKPKMHSRPPAARYKIEFQDCEPADSRYDVNLAGNTSYSMAA